jgi:two-component system response regulator RegA
MSLRANVDDFVCADLSAGVMPANLTAPSVLIVDDQEMFAQSLRGSFARAGFEARHVKDFSSASTVASEIQPELIVSEMRIDGKWIFDSAETLRQSGSRIAIATAYPSVATAIRAVREGFDGYMGKPATVDSILAAISGTHVVQDAREPSWPSLDLTIWEYINRVYVEAGSMSEAARRLRLDRRSLRRMLSKYPPPK